MPQRIQEKCILQQSADLNFKNFPFGVYPEVHSTEPLNQANSKETESSGENGCRQKCLDKSLGTNNKKIYRKNNINEYNCTNLPQRKVIKPVFRRKFSKNTSLIIQQNIYFHQLNLLTQVSYPSKIQVPITIKLQLLYTFLIL